MHTVYASHELTGVRLSGTYNNAAIIYTGVIETAFQSAHLCLTTISGCHSPLTTRGI